MKAEAAFIQWHRSQPITSVDFSPLQPGRFASCGGDCYVRIVFSSTLVGHSAGVNVVRWSPKSSEIIASADDAGAIVLWKQIPASPENLRNVMIDEDTSAYSECWRQARLLSGHKDEVSDIAWSPCARYLASVGTDQKLRVWDVRSGEVVGSVHHHSEVVQGVAWDPIGEYLATQSLDRYVLTNASSVIIYAVAFKHIAHQRSAAILTLVQRSARIDYLDGARRVPCRLYSDAVFGGMSFFRRLNFSPDGSLLACPAAQLSVPLGASIVAEQKSDALDPSGSAEEQNLSCALEEEKPPQHAVMVYSRHSIAGIPAFCLPGMRHAPWVVRFSPLCYPLRAEMPSELVDLPYRMLLAIGTDNELVIHDTQSLYPIASATNLHLYRYQDISWSADGLQIIAASHDGFCTLICLTELEIGTPLAVQPFKKPEISENFAASETAADCLIPKLMQLNSNGPPKKRIVPVSIDSSNDKTQ